MLKAGKVYKTKITTDERKELPLLQLEKMLRRKRLRYTLYFLYYKWRGCRVFERLSF